MATTDNHQGVIAIVPPFEYCDIDVILDCAKNNLVKTLVFCCISTGENKFPKNEACKIAVDTVNEYLDVNDKFFSKIIFDVFTDEDFDIYEECLTK